MAQYAISNPSGEYEVLEAEHVTFGEGGALVMRDGLFGLIAAYAAGQWLAVVPFEDGDE